MNKNKKRVREIALELLESIEKNQAYSNLLLNQAINRNQIKGPDVGLLTELVYGTLQRRDTLDYYLQPFLKKKVDQWVRILLRLSLYQMVYLDKIPERAIIFEAVEIAKKRGHKGISSMVNGVLRSVQRQGISTFDQITDPIKRVAIETSHPVWLVERWVKQFGFEKTKAMCLENLIPPVQTARVNTVKTTRDKVIESFQAEGIDAKPSEILPVSIQISKGNIAHTDVYKNGDVSIQDESSMVVAYALRLEEGFHVLDMCAAPGGKTAHIAEFLHGTGVVDALDLHEHKVKLIRENADRLQLDNIVERTMDSREASEYLEKTSYDRVLVDAPCSGLGVLKRKPDIKYTKQLKDIERLSEIQASLLDEAAKLVKVNGILVYSTCTVDQLENEKQMEDFLQRHPEFEPVNVHVPETLNDLVEKDQYTLQIFPQDFGSDGFFISSVRKKKE